MTQVKKCETRFRRKEVFRSLVESRVGWNYCIKHFFKSRQSFDWSLSVQTVNWNRIMTSCRKWIWVEVTPQTQNLLALRNRTEPSSLFPPLQRATSQLWPPLNFQGVWRAGLWSQRFISAHLYWKTRQGKCKKGAKTKWMETIKRHFFFFFFFFPWSPINWNCWSLHRSN